MTLIDLEKLHELADLIMRYRNPTIYKMGIANDAEKLTMLRYLCNIGFVGYDEVQAEHGPLRIYSTKQPLIDFYHVYKGEPHE